MENFEENLLSSTESPIDGVLRKEFVDLIDFLK